MHRRLVFNIVSRILMVVCLLMLIPMGWAMADDPASAETRAFLITIAVGLALTAAARRLLPATTEDFEVFGAKDGLAVVGLTWLAVSLLGALPFVLSGTTSSFTDAFFETVSGFTTTGATIFDQIEPLPRGILFWRSFTHWLGGMGIIVLSVALLPAIGRGAYQLYRAEAPGPSAERLRPRMKETAVTLWSVYFVLSFAETLLLMAGGMPLFDALCHTFGTMATGGFSTKTASIGVYGPYIQWIVVIFMGMAGANFLLHYQALRGRPLAYFRSEEFRVYLGLVLGATFLFSAVLSFTSGGFSEKIVRTSAFQVVSILTTTGYTTTDFDLWPAVLKVTLILLMCVGGCAGSTGGGIKVIRTYVALKVGLNSILRALLPNAVIPLKVESRPVSAVYIQAAAAYFILFVFLFGAGTVMFALTEDTDLETAYSAVIASLSNIGPGLGKVGATRSYSWISAPGKWLLSFLMLAGRLELYSILILLTPAAWKK